MKDYIKIFLEYVWYGLLISGFSYILGMHYFNGNKPIVIAAAIIFPLISATIITYGWKKVKDALLELEKEEQK